MLVLDIYLPKVEIDTTVARIEKGATSHKLAYHIPLSGGDEDVCSVGDGESQALMSGAEVIVEKTFLLGRCINVKPIRCDGVVCLSGRINTINWEALMQQSLQIAYRGKFDNFVSLAAAHPGYSPQIRRWPDVRGALDPELFSVRLPDRVVIFDKDVNYKGTHMCGSVGGYC